MKHPPFPTDMPAMTQTQARLLACYESVGEAVQRMRAAASAADWRALEAGERACAKLIEGIRAFGDPLQVLDAEGRRRRLEILRRVLRDDAAIREYAQPSLARVDTHLGRRRTEADR